jgi:hypothetical protein
VTRNTGAGNIYVDSTEPTDKASGTIWIDISTASSPKLYIATGSAYVQQTAGALGNASTKLGVNSGGTALEFAVLAGFSNKQTSTTVASNAIEITLTTAADFVLGYFEATYSGGSAVDFTINRIAGTAYNTGALKDTAKSTYTSRAAWLGFDSTTSASGSFLIRKGASETSFNCLAGNNSTTLSTSYGTHTNTSQITHVALTTLSATTLNSGRLTIIYGTYA